MGPVTGHRSTSSSFKATCTIAKEQAIVLHHLASTLCKLGNYAQAKELAEQGLALTGSLDEKQLRSRLLQTLGDIADNEGDGAHAEAYYHEGLQLARHTQKA